MQSPGRWQRNDMILYLKGLHGLLYWKLTKGWEGGKLKVLVIGYYCNLGESCLWSKPEATVHGDGEKWLVRF